MGRSGRGREDPAAEVLDRLDELDAVLVVGLRQDARQDPRASLLGREAHLHADARAEGAAERLRRVAEVRGLAPRFEGCGERRDDRRQCLEWAVTNG